ncbi:MAG: DUF6454 family protein [Xenococcaceae cyanobacterium]
MKADEVMRNSSERRREVRGKNLHILVTGLSLTLIILITGLSLILGGGVMALAAEEAPANETVIARFKLLTDDTDWQSVASVPVKFRTYHPQGMAKVADVLFVSSVEIKVKPTKFETPQNGYDRSPGEGIGHLFKLDHEGNLIDQITLGEGSIYHPGGIDYDGRWLWVSVAEYRPNSQSIIYRVDPDSMEATEMFRFPDHISGILHNTDDGNLYGLSWGSRQFYRWKLDQNLNVLAPLSSEPILNESYYIDYQDCRYLGRRMILCSGLNTYRPSSDGMAFKLGGLELVDLASNTAVHQIPVQLWTEDGLPLTQNPVYVESTNVGLRVYFMPEDDKSRLFVYDVNVK